MKKKLPLLLTVVVAAPLAVASILLASGIKGSAPRGQRVFGACAACHSLQPDKNMTGPSLANLWNRKAGRLPSFSRYSPALKSSDIVWNDDTLDEWIKDPQHLVPGNEMTFAGIKDAQPRADLLAFLKEAQKGGSQTAQQEGGQMGGMMGGMGGMMGGGQVPNLKKPYSAQRVQTITYCKDTYTVTTANGRARQFWERNLRLKTDASEDGPEKNAPALVDAGMMGDRADVIFADPSEISPFITPKC
jgi:cytochrome c